MTSLPLSQLAILISAQFLTQGGAPVIATAPTLAAVTAAQAPTYTSASGISGTPTPTLRHDLYVNAALKVTGYVSGTASAATAAIAAGDQVSVRAVATNPYGVVTLGSNVVTATSAGVSAFTQQTPPNGNVSINFPYPLPQPSPRQYAPFMDWDYWFQATNATSYAISSGAIPPGCIFDTTSGRVRGWVPTAGTYNFTVSAVTPSGTVFSSPQSVTFGYVATLLGTPIVGRPMPYIIRGFTGTVISQQWYRNDGLGAGPVAISGATGAMYTPVAGDIGYWLSVRVVTDTAGTVSSIEFTTKGTLLSQSAVLQGVSPTSGRPSVTRINSSFTHLAPMSIRLGSANASAFVNYYRDLVVAPGTYLGFASYGTIPGGATEATIYTYSTQNLGTTAVIAGRTFPATATRPAGNTGTGFFTAGGALYDPNGNRFQVRGLNKLHAGEGSPGMLNAKPTSIRVWLDLSTDFATINKPLIESYIAAKVVPKLCMSGVFVKFTATFDGTNQMTVTAMTSNQLGYIYVGMTIGGGTTGIPACSIVSCPGGAQIGKTGVYTVSVNVPATTVSNLGTFYGATNLPNVNLLASVAQTWADMYSLFQPYEDKIMINIANEWGPVASSSNTQWRDTYITAIRDVIRPAGYKCPIIIDACGNGQDSGTAYGLLNHIRAIQDADPQKNIIGSLHIYGHWASAGSHVPTLVALTNKSADAATGGVPYMIGEFGPGRNVDIAAVNGGSTTPLEIMSTTEGLGMAGWYYWAWDDHVMTPPIHEADNWYSCCYIYTTGYSSKNPADLTIAGTDVVLNPLYGTNFSTPATIF